MTVLKEIFSWVKTIVFSIALAVVINLFIFRPSQVLGNSMQPRLNDGDFGIVYRVPYFLKSIPEYGDIVIIDSRVQHRHTLKDDLTDMYKYNMISNMLFKQENRNYWIKRVIGKPGDELEFKNGKVYRNGTAIDEPYIKEPMEYASNEKITVPENYLFVMGDNRNNSSDSRVIGPVPMQNVLGKYVLSLK